MDQKEWSQGTRLSLHSEPGPSLLLCFLVSTHVPPLHLQLPFCSSTKLFHLLAVRILSQTHLFSLCMMQHQAFHDSSTKDNGPHYLAPHSPQGNPWLFQLLRAETSVRRSSPNTMTHR